MQEHEHVFYGLGDVAGDSAGELPVDPGAPLLLQAPNVVAKVSKRAKLINFLFIHSSVFQTASKGLFR